MDIPYKLGDRYDGDTWYAPLDFLYFLSTKSLRFWELHSTLLERCHENDVVGFRVMITHTGLYIFNITIYKAYHYWMIIWTVSLEACLHKIPQSMKPNKMNVSL